MIKKLKTKILFIMFLLFVTSAGVFAELITPELLLKNAMENNTELQKLNIESRQAQIDLQNAKAARLPSVDFQTSLSWMSKPLVDPIKLTAGQLGVYDVGGNSLLMPMEDLTIYKGMENTFYEFKFLIDQPVYAWGKITNSIKLYSRVSETSALVIESKKNEVRTKINIYFHTLYYINEIEKKIKLQISDASRIINIAEDSYNNGFILYTDLLNARIQAKKLLIAEVELREQKEEALLTLSQLTGLKDLDINFFDFQLIEPLESIKISNADEYMNASLKNSPELKILNILRGINELRVEISKGSENFKPDIGLHFELGYSGPRFPFIEADWYGEDSIGLTSTIALKTTIYEGGKQKLAVERGLEELEKSYYEYESGIDALGHLITESVLKLDLNRQNIEYYRLLQENDKAQISIKQTQIDAGAGNETEMLKEKVNLNIHVIEEYRESIEFYKNYFTLIGSASADISDKFSDNKD